MSMKPPTRTRTLEDVIVSFLIQHVGKIYLGLALAAVLVHQFSQGGAAAVSIP